MSRPGSGETLPTFPAADPPSARMAHPPIGGCGRRTPPDTSPIGSPKGHGNSGKAALRVASGGASRHGTARRSNAPTSRPAPANGHRAFREPRSRRPRARPSGSVRGTDRHPSADRHATAGNVEPRPPVARFEPHTLEPGDTGRPGRRPEPSEIAIRPFRVRCRQCMSDHRDTERQNRSRRAQRRRHARLRGECVPPMDPGRNHVPDGGRQAIVPRHRPKLARGRQGCRLQRHRLSPLSPWA